MVRMRSHAAKHDVYRVLCSAGVAMSAYKILDAVRPCGISAPIIVYRALKLLVQQGRAHHLETINAYVARAAPPSHFGIPILAICSDCGVVDELFDDSIVQRLQANRDFKINSKAIEVKGQCIACQTLHSSL